MSSCGLQKNHLLHSCVGCTADVTGDHHQAARVEACHHSKQIDLEPQLKVFRLICFKSRSKGCQGQVQDGISNIWIFDEGDVFLEIKRFTYQFRETFDISEIIVMRARSVTHLWKLVHQGHHSSHHRLPIIQVAYQKRII